MLSKNIHSLAYIASSSTYDQNTPLGIISKLIKNFLNINTDKDKVSNAMIHIDNTDNEKNNKAPQYIDNQVNLVKSDIDFGYYWRASIPNNVLINNSVINVSNGHINDYTDNEGLVPFMPSIVNDSRFNELCNLFPAYKNALIRHSNLLDINKIYLMHRLFCENLCITINIDKKNLQNIDTTNSEDSSMNIISSTEIMLLTKRRVNKNNNMFKYDLLEDMITEEKKQIKRHRTNKSLYLFFEAIINYSSCENNTINKNIQAVSTKYTHLSNVCSYKEINNYRKKILQHDALSDLL